MSEVVKIATVGRVSPQGITRQVHRNVIDSNKSPHEDVGLRCANPTYGAGHINAYREMWDIPNEAVPGDGV